MRGKDLFPLQVQSISEGSRGRNWRVCALPSIQEALGSGTATQTRYGGAHLAPQTGRGRIEDKVGTSHTGRWGQQGLRETLRQKRRTVK